MNDEDTKQSRGGRRYVALVKRCWDTILAATRSRGGHLQVSLDSLYLDPNNFRFAYHPDYHKVDSDDVFNGDVQRRTTMFVLGRDQANVQDLISSFKQNGWLELDPIFVKKQGRRYLVIEGNRRVATLKHLQERYEASAIDLGRLKPTNFSQLPVVLHAAADELRHLLMMGLHHISGKRRWPAVSRAMAIKRLHEHLDANAVCNSLGITKRDFNLSMRTLALVDAYKESDFGDQFESDHYNLLREVLTSPSMRDWLGWDNDTLRAANGSNLERLFQWMSTEPEPDDHDRDDTRGPVSVDPVLTTVGHVRDMAKFIDDPRAVKELEETRSLQQATLASEIAVKNDIDRAFASCDRGLDKLTSQRRLEGDDLDRVNQIIGRFQELALTHNRRPLGDTTERMLWEPFNESTLSQFSDVQIGAYRGIAGVSLDGLRRINLIAGVNNAGKTSVLEAVHLLSHQNDETALLNTMRWRGKWEGQPDPNWLVDQIPPHICVSGRFDEIKNNTAEVVVRRKDDADERIGDQASFLKRYLIESRYGSWVQSTDVALFSDRPHRAYFDAQGPEADRETLHGRNWLCRCSFTSPFGANRMDALVKAHDVALKAGTKANVIAFIKEKIDSHMGNIEFSDTQHRFLATHSEYEKAPDLASFGDGLWRVFEIGMLLASVRGGVLLIDEFESAIHPQLLGDFARIVQRLAVDLDVQVFLTTHSKEALDAFITNSDKADDVAAYALRRCPGGIDVRRFDGNQLLLLHDAADFDLRGVV